MAVIDSAFAVGKGKVKGISGFQYNDAAGGSFDVSLPINSSAAISADSLAATNGITGAELNIGSAALAADGFAISTDAAGGGDTKLATAGYVDAQVAGVSAGISLQDFTVSTASGLAVGNAVCLATGANAPLALADKGGDDSSNAIGIIKAINGSVVTVQLDAEIAVSTSLTGIALGTPMFVGAAGALVQYSALASGDWATQVGYVSDAAANKIVILPKSWGQV